MEKAEGRTMKRVSSLAQIWQFHRFPQKAYPAHVGYGMRGDSEKRWRELGGKETSKGPLREEV